MQLNLSSQCATHPHSQMHLCTHPACSPQMPICPACPPHVHPTYVIPMAILQQRVHDLMKKRIQLEEQWECAWEGCMGELGKFKKWKAEVIDLLNYRERALNQLCRNMKKSVTFDKDKHLFKKTLNTIYLSLRSLNPNYQTYSLFRTTFHQTLAELNQSIFTLKSNLNDFPILLKKQLQLCSTLKKCSQTAINEIKYLQPKFDSFKKEIVKFKFLKNEQKPHSNVGSRLFRISDGQFLLWHKYSPLLKLYNQNSLGAYKTLSLSFQIDKLTVLDRNLLISNHHGQLLLYDLLNERVLKHLAARQHKSSQLTSLLSISPNTALATLSHPNQIVVMRSNQQKIQVVKGIELSNSCRNCIGDDDVLMGYFQDGKIRSYRDAIELQRQWMIPHYLHQQMPNYHFAPHSIAKLDNNNYYVGHLDRLVHIDRRMENIVSQVSIGSFPVIDLKKIYPTSLLVSAEGGKSIKIMECRMQREMISMKMEDAVEAIEVMDSVSFVAATGRGLTYFTGVGGRKPSA